MEKGEAKVRVEEEDEGLEGKETNLSLLVICSEDEVRESARNETSINVDAEERTDHDVRRLDQTKEEDLEVSFVGRVKDERELKTERTLTSRCMIPLEWQKSRAWMRLKSLDELGSFQCSSSSERESNERTRSVEL